MHSPSLAIRPAGRAGHTRADIQRLLRDNRDVACALLLYVVFALNFGAYRVFGDGVDYFSFDQRLFGDTSAGTAYGFGTGLLNAPFYAVGKLATVAGVTTPSGASLTAASITFASISSWWPRASLVRRSGTTARSRRPTPTQRTPL